MLYLRFRTQRRQPRRRQVCARRDALSSWHEVRRPLSHRPGPSTHARDCRRRSEAPPAPAAPSCRRHTGAPQARLDPPPRTALRRRLVSILHPGRPCAAGSSRSSTRVESGLGVGSCPRLALRAAWSPSSSPSCALRADRARAAGATPHASQFCSREPPPPPLVCPLRGAPLGLAAPPPPCTLAHATRLGLGRSALVGDLAAAARREPRRRPDGKSVRSCESSPGAVCCVQCNTVRSHSLFWTLLFLWCAAVPPLESI